jgi:tetratricopeptide (TPR) repeat protein
LIEAGLAFGGLALGLHALIDFSLHEVPTAFTGAVLLGLAAGERGGRGSNEKQGERRQPALRASRLLCALLLVVGMAAAVAVGVAENAYRKAYAVLSEGDLDGSERWLGRALRLSPDRARDWVALAEISRQRARLAESAVARRASLLEAAARFDTAARIEPQVARRWLRAARALDEARAAGAEVDPAHIGAHLERAVAGNSQLVEAHVELAGWSRAAGDLAGAERALTSAAEVAPGDPRLAVERGRLALARGDQRAAIAAFGSGAGIDGPAGGAALDQLAALAAGGTEWEAEAEAALNAVAARGGAVGAEAERRLGDLAFSAGDREAARGWYERARSLSSSPELDLGLGNLAYAEGAFGEAERHYRAAVRARPQMAEAIQNLGNVAIARGDTALARRLYARALALRPENEALRAYIATLETRGAP